MPLLPISDDDAELKEYRKYLLETSPYKDLRMKDPRHRLDEERWILENEEQFRKLRSKQKRRAVIAKSATAIKGIGTHLLRLSSAVALWSIMITGGTMAEVFLMADQMRGPFYTPVGAAIGMVLWVPLWYWVIRRGKPVWQPGRRFWARWFWVQVIFVPVALVGPAPGMIIGLAANAIFFLMFLWDAVKNRDEFEITKPAL